MFFNTPPIHPSILPSIHPSILPSIHPIIRPSIDCFVFFHPSIQMSPIKKQTIRVLFSLSFSRFPSMSLDVILFLSHVFIVFFVTPLHSLTLLHSPKFCFTISLLHSISHSFNKGRKYVWEGKVVDEAKMVEKEVRIW